MPSVPGSPKPLLRPTLLSEGQTDRVISGLHRRSEWNRIRPGAYLDADHWRGLEPADRHRLLIASTVPKLGDAAIISHSSAALLHDLPIGGADTDRVHFTRNQPNGGYRRGRVYAHVGPLPSSMVTMVGDVAVTSVARTVIDCACTLNFSSAVCLADSALHRRLTTRPELEEALAVPGRRRGRRQAELVVRFADGRSESVGESQSRVGFWRCGLPPPETQFTIYSGNELVGRSDFGWKEFRTLGEFDGRVKYLKYLKPGQTPSDAVWEEKRRELALRRLGWEVVRWVWEDLANPEHIAAQLREAFARGSAG